ncbi:hypothetical protein ACIA6D_30820 [Streptomyces cacaoi]|uniref:hypothetical protein n=1 Tax=Streptomyces cacaoi TaxID=1898 RepID=UPI00374A518C
MGQPGNGDENDLGKIAVPGRPSSCSIEVRRRRGAGGASFGKGRLEPQAIYAAAAAAISCPGHRGVAVLVADLQLLDAASCVLLRQLVDARAVFLSMPSSE